MGKDLRSEHISFFTDRMDEHHLVGSWEVIDNQHEYLFKVRRTLFGSESEVVVHLTDAYCYSLAEFYVRPNQLQAGSYVVIGMPHADAEREVIELAKKERIGIGHNKKFMGALNLENVWEYLSPEEREQKREEQRRRKQRRKTN